MSRREIHKVKLRVGLHKPLILIGVLVAHAWAIGLLAQGRDASITPARPLVMEVRTLATPASSASVPRSLAQPKPKEAPKLLSKPVAAAKTLQATDPAKSNPSASIQPIAVTKAASSPIAPSAPSVSSASPDVAKPQSVAPAPESAPVTGAQIRDTQMLNPGAIYPALSRINNEQGRVVIRARIGTQGGVESANIKTSSGYPRLDNAALLAVQQARFRPAKKGEEAIASTVDIPFHFQLND